MDCGEKFLHYKKMATSEMSLFNHWAGEWKKPDQLWALHLFYKYNIQLCTIGA